MYILYIVKCKCDYVHTLYICIDVTKTKTDDKWQTRPLVREDATRQHTVMVRPLTKNLVMSPNRGSTPRQTGWLTVSRKVTWTWNNHTSDLKMDSTYSSKMLVSTYKSTEHYYPEDQQWQVPLCEHYPIFLHDGGVSDDILVPNQPHDIVGGKWQEQLHVDRYPCAPQRSAQRTMFI
jgi:hypothetical protein